MEISLEKVDRGEADAFRSMVEAYWHELMSQSPVVQNATSREEYFAIRFSWDGKSGHPYWALADGERVGFLMFRTAEDGSFAQVHDFFIVEGRRRKGIGSRVARELLSLLWEKGVLQIDLNVRADNPIALEFWRAQGFEIALHRLKLYRNADEENGA